MHNVLPYPLTLTGAYVSDEALLALRRVSGGKAQRAADAPRAGLAASRRLGRGMDFAEVRAYAAGDDVRSIDWRVTARTNEPHTKVFQEERERPVSVFVDLSQSLFFGSAVRLKSVVAAELAARHAWHALAAGDRVGGMVVGNGGATLLPARRNTRHVARFLGMVGQANRALGRDGQCPPDRLSNALGQLATGIRGGHQVVLISDFHGLSDADRGALLGLARRNAVSAWLVDDPLERVLPLRRAAEVTDGQQRRRLDAANVSVRKRYTDDAERWREAKTQLLQGCGIRLGVVSTSADPERLEPTDR